MNTFNSLTRKHLVTGQKNELRTTPPTKIVRLSALRASRSAPLIRIASHPEQALSRGKVDGFRLLGGNITPTPTPSPTGKGG